MRFRVALGALLALVCAGPAMAGTYVRVGINVGAPVVAYRHEPRWVLVPDERVYVVDDDALGYDYFRYGGFYWIYQNDRWYRSSRYNGPFAVVRADFVPEPIWRVGPREHYRWRNHPAALPPGLARRYERNHTHPGWEQEDRGHGNANGHRDGRDHGE